MKKSTVIIVIAVIVALGFVSVIQRQRREKQVAAPKEQFVRIMPKSMRAADIHKIEVYRGEEKKDAVVLERKGDGWVVASKFASKGNEKSIGDFLDDIKTLTGEVRTRKASLHGDFDITPAKAVHVSLYDKDGKLYQDLLLGKKGDRYSEGFVRLARGNEVYLASKNLLSSLGIYSEGDEPDAKKWLDLKIIDEDKEKLAKVVLDMPGKQVVLEKKEKKKEEETKTAEEEEKPEEPKPKEKKEYEWVLVSPETGFKVKDAAITSLISSVCTFSSDDVSDPAKASEYGFDPATYTATITLDDNSAKTLLIGKKIDESKQYAKLKDEETVYILPTYRITGVFKKMRDLFELEVWDLKKEDIASIQLQKPEYEMLLERRLKEGKEGKEETDYEWVLAKPESRFKLQEYRVTNIVSKLVKPTPDDLFLTGEAASYGLEPAEYKATLTMKDGTAQTVLFGKKLEDADERYVKFGGKDHFYTYSKYNFESVFPELTKLVNVTVLEGLVKDNVTSLAYKTPDGEFALTREEDTASPDKKKWTVKVGEEKSDAQKTAVDGILNGLTDLRGADLVDIAIGKSEADCGLDNPSETLVISTDKPQKQYTLLIGNKVSEERTDRYFKTQDQPEILILSNTAFADMFKKPGEIKVVTPPEPEADKEAAAELKAAPRSEQPPLPTEQPKPEEEKPAPSSEKPEEVKPETPPGGEEKPQPVAPKEKKEETTRPEPRGEGTPPPSPPEEGKGEKPESPGEERPAPEAPPEKPPIEKIDKELPPPLVPEVPGPKEPIALPPPEGSPSK
jgi:hypothetical protein